MGIIEEQSNANEHELLYRVSKKKLMPFQIQISREFRYGTLSIPIGI